MTGKQLKNSILQWAIQGKLVPQDPNDEPASVLLDKIRAEKARLIKEGKIKRDKKESIIYRGEDNSYYEKFADGKVVCIDDEIPFEVPKSWDWTRLKNISFKITDGTHKTPKYCTVGGVKFVSAKDIINGMLNFKLCKYISYEEHQLLFARCNPEKGDLLISKSGSIGSVAEVDVDFEFSLFESLALVKFDSKSINRHYLRYSIDAAFEYLSKDRIRGVAVKHLPIDSISNILIPLPPLSEQMRIVKIFDELKSLIEHYGKVHQKLDILNNGIRVKIKKSILQEAIQGKLVPQDSCDEPASVLLQRIKEEKQRLVKKGKLKKKDIADSFIFKGDDNRYYEQIDRNCIDITDDIPFDIPGNWVWTRIGYLFAHNNGKQLNKGNSSGTLLEYITTSNLYWDGFRLDNLKKMPFEENEIERCQAIKGDLLVCEGGDVGRSCIWTYDYPIMLQNHIHKLRSYLPLCTKFFFYIFYLYNLIGLIGGKGIGIQGFSAKALHNTIIPLPPLNEQEHIVKKIETVFDRIKN